jgi:RNA polymerase sigma-70 factor (ECF subfamily)
MCRLDHRTAFTELVDRYKDRIFWLIQRMVGTGEAEDLTQEVFIRMYQALPRFRGESKFSTWIYRIAHNLCLSELRKRGRRGDHLSWEEEGDEKIHWQLPAAAEGLAEEIERWDLGEKVRNHVQALPAPYREVLTLHYMHELRYEEIAEVMSVPLGTVKTYLHRAKRRLRDSVLEDDDLSYLGKETACESRER